MTRPLPVDSGLAGLEIRAELGDQKPCLDTRNRQKVTRNPDERPAFGGVSLSSIVVANRALIQVSVVGPGGGSAPLTRLAPLYHRARWGPSTGDPLTANGVGGRASGKKHQCIFQCPEAKPWARTGPCEHTQVDPVAGLTTERTLNNALPRLRT
jgi:hypothetical protein